MKLRTHLLTPALLGIIALTPFASAQDKYPDYSTLDLDPVHKKLTVLKGSTPAQWRITIKGDASTTATVSWSTLKADGEHTLHYGKKSAAGDLAAYSNKLVCQRNGKYTPGAKESDEIKKSVAHYHHARLSGLEADTTYYLTMVSNGVASKEFHFRTAKSDPDKLVMFHGGDSRSGISNRSRVNYMISKLVENQPEIYGFIHGGDYIGSGLSYNQWKAWLSQNELITTSKNRIIPMIVAKGNHDTGVLIGEIFDFVSEKEGRPPLYYYEAKIGKILSLVTLDTNIAATGAQEKFLDASLSKLRPKCTWLLAQYHRPLYPAVKNTPPHKNVFVPIFEKYNLDAALEADGHNIKRTVPIRNDKKDPTGIVYVGEGGLGVGQRSPRKNLWYLDPKEGAYASKGHHIMLLTMTKKDMEIKTILLNGGVPDKHTIKARKQP